MLPFYRLLLRLFPASFRWRFGDDMTTLFADRLREARRAGFAAVVALWIRTIGDVVAHGLRERRATRRASRASFLGTVIQDVKYALRLFGRQPAFTAVAVVTLALGIGGTTAAFSVIDAAVFRSVPYPNPEQLVRIRVESRSQDGWPYKADPSLEQLRAWMAQNQVFSRLAASNNAGALIITDDPQPARTTILETWRITEEQLALFGVSPIVGRGFGADDMREGAPDVALIGYDYWQSKYGGDGSVVGRSLHYRERFQDADQVVTIVGVLPASYWRDAKVVFPLRTSGRYQKAVGRLRPGVSLEDAQRQLTVPSTPGPRGPIRLSSLRDEAELDRNAVQLYLLSGAACLVLILACVNVAALALASAFTRQSELAVRASMGASRLRLVRQVVTESVVLSAVGGAVGLGLAWLFLDALVTTFGEGSLVPTNVRATLNPSVLMASAGLVTLTGIGTGLLPALGLSRVRLSGPLLRGGRSHGGALSRRSGQVLIAVQVALTIVVIAGAGVMIRSYLRMVSVDPGFDRGAIVTMEVAPVDQDNEAIVKAYYPALLAAIRAMPEVEAAGISNAFRMMLSDRASIASAPPLGVSTRWVTPGFLEAMGVSVRQGRLPDESDFAVLPGGVILSETAARSLFEGRSSVGALLDVSGKPREVLGVVSDLNFSAPFPSARPDVYVLNRDIGPTVASVVIRPRGRVPDLAARLDAVARSVGPLVIVDNIRTGYERLNDRVSFQRQRTVLAGSVGVIGLTLALVGIFAITAYSVRRRVHEIGVRVALGATPGRIIRATVGETCVPAAVGIIVGLTGAAVATRAIASLLFNTAPTDPVTFAIVALTFGGTACLAAWLPARRVARVDPSTALRGE